VRSNRLMMYQVEPDMLAHPPTRPFSASPRAPRGDPPGTIRHASRSPTRSTGSCAIPFSIGIFALLRTGAAKITTPFPSSSRCPHGDAAHASQSISRRRIPSISFVLRESLPWGFCVALWRCIACEASCDLFGRSYIIARRFAGW